MQRRAVPVSVQVQKRKTVWKKRENFKDGVFHFIQDKQKQRTDRNKEHTETKDIQKQRTDRNVTGERNRVSRVSRVNRVSRADGGIFQSCDLSQFEWRLN